MQSVRTALLVFEAVALHPAMGVSELARLVNEPKTTVQRCLTTLHAAGWLRPVTASGKRRAWAPSLHISAMLREADTSSLIRNTARAAMERLRSSTGETINLMQRDDRSMVLIDRLESPHPLRSVQPIGVRAPLHLSSNGKAFLAALQDSEIRAYLSAPLERGTPNAVVSADELWGELKKIRTKGFASNRGELEEGVRAVAAAIVDQSGAPIASMSISCPAARLPESKITDYGALVREAAAYVSASMGM